MLLAPRAAVEFRGRMAGSARSLGNTAEAKTDRDDNAPEHPAP